MASLHPISSAAVPPQGPETKDISQIVGKTGRVYEMSPVSILEQFRLISLLGGLAENSVYRAMLFPLQWIRAIDGEPVRRPIDLLEIEALIRRVEGDYGSLVAYLDKRAKLAQAGQKVAQEGR